MNQTSKHLHSVTRLRSVWYNALKGHILEQDLPLPRNFAYATLNTCLNNLSTEAIESVVLDTLRHTSNWRRSLPKRLSTAYAKSKIGRVFYLQFLSIKAVTSSVPLSDSDNRSRFSEDTEGRYVVTAGYSKDNILCLQVWDLDTRFAHHTVRPVSEWEEGGRLFGMAVEDDIGFTNAYQGQVIEDGALIAFCVRTLSTYVHICIHSLC